MNVAVTKNLSAEMQAVADCREAAKLAEAEVERCKGELKTAKAIWEERVADLNRAVDDMIDKEKEPTLFDDLSDPPQPATETTPGGPGGDGSGGAGGDIVDAEYSTALVPTGQHGAGEEVAAVPAAVPLSLPAASAAEPPTWHRLRIDDAFETEVDIPTAVIDTLKAAGVETCGSLAAKLVEGESFGLAEKHVEYLRRAIEQLSEDDERPVVLTSEGNADADASDAEDDGSRDPSAAARWERMFARDPAAYSTPGDERRRKKIADFRARQAAGEGHDAPRWGLWSEFAVKLATGEEIAVSYEPADFETDELFADHFEFFGESISKTGYRSHYENFTKKSPRPSGESLVEWAREFAESLYVERQAELKKKPARGKSGKSTSKTSKKGKVVAA